MLINVMLIGVGEGGRGQPFPQPRLEFIRANLHGTYPGKFENICTYQKIKLFFYYFFRDHTNPMRKKGKILVKTFLFFIDHTNLM